MTPEEALSVAFGARFADGWRIFCDWDGLLASAPPAPTLPTSCA